MSDLITQLMKKEITKRDFIKLGGIGLFCYVVGIPVLNEAQGIVSKTVHNEATKIIKPNEYAWNLVYRIFGKLNENYKYIPGTNHFLYPGSMHPDDQFACSTLESAGISGISKLKIVNNFHRPKDLEGNIVCLGSPMSNFLSSEMFQYFQANGVRENGLMRKKEKILFETPFEYVLDSKLLMNKSICANRLVGQSNIPIPNWSIYDNENDKFIIPKVTKQNTLTDDYLLITVIPNCVTKKSYENGDKVVIFGGTHGVGTMAIDPLFRDINALTTLKEKTKNIKYWQALIKSTDIGIHDKHGRNFPFSVSSNIDVRPLTPIRKNIEIFPVTRAATA